MILIANGERIECSRVVRNGDTISALDENGSSIVSYFGIKNFDSYTTEGGVIEHVIPDKERIAQLEAALTAIEEGIASV